jgi:hypothetical protein
LQGLLMLGFWLQLLLLLSPLPLPTSAFTRQQKRQQGNFSNVLLMVQCSFFPGLCNIRAATCYYCPLRPKHDDSQVRTQ